MDFDYEESVYLAADLLERMEEMVRQRLKLKRQMTRRSRHEKYRK